MLRRKVDVTGFKEEVERLRRSRLAVILLVYFALVMDNMLLTVVVPIIPDYLYQMEYQQTEKWSQMKAGNVTTDSNPQQQTVTEERLRPTGLPSGLEITGGSDSLATSLGLSIQSSKLNMPVSTTQHLQNNYPPVLSNASSNIIHTLNKNLLRFQSRSSSSGRPPDKIGPRNYYVKTTQPYNNFKSQKSQREEIISDQKHITNLSNYSLHNPFTRNIKQTKMFTISTSQHPVSELSSDIQTHRAQDTRRESESNGASRLQKMTSTTSKQSTKFQRNVNNARQDTFSTRNLSNIKEPLSHYGTKPEMTIPRKQYNDSETSKSVDGTASLKQNLSTHEGEDILPQDIINENGRVGLLFSSKAFVQLIVNPFIGPLTSRIGYSLPLLVGTQNLIISAILFAYAESYTLLFIARSIQGIASSCIAISGMGIVAECYPDDRERGRMQGMVMGGIALGVLAGYPLGGLLYDFTNSKTPPFLLVAVLTAILAMIQLAVLNPRPTPERLVVATPLRSLIRDPYILVTAGAIMVSTSAMAVLEPCLPIWLTDTLHPQKWQLGTAFIPDSLGYLVGTSCTAGPSYRIGRWRAAVIAMMMVAFAAATVPEAGSMLALAGPHLFLGMGVGTVDAALMPLLAAIVDARHVAAYGAVYAIAQLAVALAYGFGPLLGGAIVRQIGFPWLMRGVAILNLCYCPLLLSLTTFNSDSSESQAILMAAPDPNDFYCHSTASVQPKEASLRYKQLFDEEDD